MSELEQQKQVLKEIQDTIRSMPAETQETVRLAHDIIRLAVKHYGDEGLLALALLGAEKSVEAG